MLHQASFFCEESLKNSLNFRYNYIAKQENLDDEINAFLDTIDVDILPRLMMGNMTSELVEQYMSQIGPWNIKALARKYIYDFELYNYPLSKYLPMKSTDPIWQTQLILVTLATHISSTTKATKLHTQILQTYTKQF